MQKSRVSLSLKVLCQLAMLTAISIVAGKYLAIGIGTVLRFSLENLPIIFAGIAFGPVAGILVGVAADLIGCMLVGYEVNLIVTIGAALIGATSGLCALLLSERRRPPSTDVTVISTIIAHLLGSVVIKTIGLAVFYDMPIIILMLWRLLNYVVVGAIESVLLVIIFRNKQLSRIVKNAIRKESQDKDFKKFANSFQAVTVPGLDRIAALCELLGNPEDELKIIHVAGTNGKGSTCQNLAAILEAAGYKTGKYISPNLIKVNERISINGKDISDGELDAILTELQPHTLTVEERCGLAPTQFEIWTAAALLYFARCKCDYVVLEVGLGGELDATNVIKKNELAIITRLGLDHTQYLGDTLASVARAKCGIIKTNSRLGAVITPKQDEEAMAVINEHARSLGISVIVAEPTEESTHGIYESFSVGGISNIECGIPGLHQIENAALAALAARRLGIDEETIRLGIKRAKNPARFELIDTDPTVIYDGGHNENGITALNASLKKYYPDTPRTVIFACMRDKEIGESLRLLSEGDTSFIFTTVKDNPRAATAEETKSRASTLGYEGEAREEIGEAYELARERGLLTVICGSLYLYKDLREYLDKRGEK